MTEGQSRVQRLRSKVATMGVVVNHRSKTLASGRKRLDLCAAQVAHLEDHRSMVEDPFQFLEQDHFDEGDESRRGNRLRPSQWLKRFAGVERLESEILFQRCNLQARRPASIVADVEYTDLEDLMATNVAVRSIKV